MPDEEHERRFHGAAERLRAAQRIARLEVDRVVALSLEGLAASRVLDVGTGTGVFAEAFVAKGLEVAGIDANSELLRVARGLVKKAEFKEALAEAIPYEDGSFDLVFMGHVLHEADDPAKALAEARRVSKARVAVLEWPYLREEDGPPIEHRLERQTILDMAERAGLVRVELLKLSRMDLYRMAVTWGVP